jgi:protein-S-isoprenylcysteine O-methyltransferase Ste14
MGLKGFDKFREKVPILSGLKVFFLPLYSLAALCAALGIQLAADALPGLLGAHGGKALLSLLPLAGVLVTAGLGLLLVWQMWFQTDRLKKKYGALSYQRIFFAGFAGVLFVFSIALHQFVPFYTLSPSYWQVSRLAILATPIGELMTLGNALVSARIALSAFSGLAGILLALRALLTFGFDYMTVVYLYFPEESEIQQHEIYSVLRHPAYGGLLWLNLSGAFLTFTIHSFLVFVIHCLGFWIHVHFVEERELISRFGKTYAEHRKRVPAFFTLRFGVLFRFLLGLQAKGK